MTTLENALNMLKTVRRWQVMKRRKTIRLFPDVRGGKDAWSIYNEVKQLAGPEFGKKTICSVYGGYAELCFRW